MTYTLTPSPAPAGAPPPLLVLDACVLMSSVIRLLLLRLAEQQAYMPVWSTRIGEEWRRNAARLWGVGSETLAAQWMSMQQRFPSADAGDVTPYETGLRYSDPKDFHVIAAGLAKRARCGLQQAPAVAVLTWNLKDFNRSELRRQKLDVFSPDRLLSLWWGQNPDPIRRSLEYTPADVVGLGRDPEPLDTTLGRERLHRLRALVGRHPACPA